MEDYKKSKEWNCLNNIWKSIPKEYREINMENFKCLSEFVKSSHKKHCSLKNADDEYKYLDDVSIEAKQLVIDLINDGEKNLYHSIMAIIENHSELFDSADDLLEYYKKRYSTTRPYILEYEEEIVEIIELCFNRMKERGFI